MALGQLDEAEVSLRNEFTQDIRSLLQNGDPDPEAAKLFADPAARYGFLQLSDRQDQGLAHAEFGAGNRCTFRPRPWAAGGWRDSPSRD